MALAVGILFGTGVLFAIDCRKHFSFQGVRG